MGSGGVVARGNRGVPQSGQSLGPAAKAGGRGRLIFALDATMSRQPTWDQACVLQAEMFREAAAAGGLDIQLVYYRGLGGMPRLALGRRAAAARRTDVAHRLPRRPYPNRQGSRSCAARKRQGAKIGALVFVGDAMEEALDDLMRRAGELGLRNVPAFMFQEGYDPICEQAFREIARLTRGAYCRFAPGAAMSYASCCARRRLMRLAA